MNISSKDIENIASLSRINFNKSESEQLRKRLIKILFWIEQLKKINVKNIKPKYSMFVKNMPYQVKLNNMMNIKDIIKNSPEYNSNMFCIPKVLK